MPCYNASNTIDCTLESVQKQTFQNFEVLLIDDCSTDSTVQKLKNWEEKDHRFKALSMEHNSGGPAEPRNKGIENASGDFICFLDSDDIWYEKKLDIQLNFINSNNIDFCSSRIFCFSEIPLDFNAICKDINPSNSKSVNYNKLLKKNIIYTSSVMISKELIKEEKFISDRDYTAIEDFEMWLRILKKGSKCYVIDTPLVGYRESYSQISRSKYNMAKKYWMVLGNYFENFQYEKYYYYVHYAIISFIQLLKKIILQDKVR